MPMINMSEAIAAYGQALDKASGGAGEPEGGGASDFAGLLREAAADAIGTLETAEHQSLQAAAGAADLNQLVTAMAEAEITLQTVVTVRDRVIQAYQEILRMPI